MYIVQILFKLVLFVINIFVPHAQLYISVKRCFIVLLKMIMCMKSYVTKQLITVTTAHLELIASQYYGLEFRWETRSFRMRKLLSCITEG